MGEAHEVRVVTGVFVQGQVRMLDGENGQIAGEVDEM
jgi:hypothetical protein